MLYADLWQHSSLPSERQERIFFNLQFRTPRTYLLLLSFKLYFLHFIISIIKSSKSSTSLRLVGVLFFGSKPNPKMMMKDIKNNDNKNDHFL